MNLYTWLTSSRCEYCEKVKPDVWCRGYAGINMCDACDLAEEKEIEESAKQLLKVVRKK